MSRPFFLFYYRFLLFYFCFLFPRSPHTFYFITVFLSIHFNTSPLPIFLFCFSSKPTKQSRVTKKASCYFVVIFHFHFSFFQLFCCFRVAFFVFKRKERKRVKREERKGSFFIHSFLPFHPSFFGLHRRKWKERRESECDGKGEYFLYSPF